MSIDLNKARAARREANKEAPEVVIGDQKFVLPVEMPFAVTEHLAVLKDAEERKENALVATAILNILRVLFGADYEAFMEQAPSMQDLEVLLEQLMAEYGIGNEDDEK